MGILFGTDGVRGIANTELSPLLAFDLGKAGAYVLSKEKPAPVVIIGKDTRISGDMLEDAISAGILSMGGSVIKAGILPTPAIAYLVRHFHADAGIMISASHNTFEYNGIKFFSGDGLKLADELEDQIEEILIRDMDVSSHITGEKIGHCIPAGDSAEEIYADFLTGQAIAECGEETPFARLKLVLDCANGAACRVAARVFTGLGAEVTTIGDEPNGTNINAACGSTNPKALQKAVMEQGADMGFAFDGDGDRLIAVDDRGGLLDGDKIICICAKMLKEEGRLEKDLVTVTIMSNLGLHKYLEAAGCSVDVTPVGDRYVSERMQETGCVLGGEQSGHIIFRQNHTAGDGILSALQLLRAVKRSGEKAGRLAEDITIYPQVLKNAAVKRENKKKYDSDPEIRAEIERITAEMQGEGRILIRPSGTEPLVRVMIEGRDIETITAMAQHLAMLITRKFG